jgi:hypothetical protein
MPYTIAAASQANGGDALGLDPANGDRLWLAYSMSWETAAGDSVAHQLAAQMTANIEKYAKTHYANVQNSNYRAGDLMYEEYNPIFMNDAMSDHDPLHSYGRATYQRLKNFQRAVDPTGFFASRTGGFKYT